MNNITDTEVEKVMKDGGIELCDRAIDQWMSGKYTPGWPFDVKPEYEKQRQEWIVKWQEMRQKIRKYWEK